jgi:hypothetical protein
MAMALSAFCRHREMPRINRLPEKGLPRATRLRATDPAKGISLGHNPEISPEHNLEASLERSPEINLMVDLTGTALATVRAATGQTMEMVVINRPRAPGETIRLRAIRRRVTGHRRLLRPGIVLTNRAVRETAHSAGWVMARTPAIPATAGRPVAGDVRAATGAAHVPQAAVVGAREAAAEALPRETNEIKNEIFYHMKTFKLNSGGVAPKQKFWRCLLCLLVPALVFGRPLLVRAADTGKTFATPDEAVTALVTAVDAKDHNALRTIFGPALANIENPDLVQATNDLTAFATALDQTNVLVHDSDTHCTLEVGSDLWPFPIPLVQQDGQWFFDTAAGQDEILNRRIGRNELATLDVVRAYVNAQREYASRDRIGDGVLQFAQHFISSPGKQDGLYWPEDLDAEISPLGPLVANAEAAGYTIKPRTPGEGANVRQPYNGYYFKILKSQGKHAPGGAYHYVINGNMIGGFALVAWPADYGRTGVMTLIVNQQGLVFQKDLGKKTGKLAASMKKYDPDSSWELSPD